MHIHVTQLWPAPKVIYRFDTQGKPNQFTETLFYIPIPRWADLSQLDSQIYHLIQHSHRSFDAIILRAHCKESEFLLGASEKLKLIIEHALHRVEGRPIWVMFWEENGYKFTRLGQLSDDVAEEVTPSAPLENWTLDETYTKTLEIQLRQAELMSWTTENGALLPSVKECHYVGPNGSHYKSFLRVGVITRSIDVLDSLAFWLLPYLLAKHPKQPLILLDSWTILSVGLNCQRYIEECGYVESHQIGMVECLHDYEEISDDLIRRLKGLSAARPDVPEILLIVSVTSSNRLATRLFEACQGEGWSVDVVSLFSSHVDDSLSSEKSMVSQTQSPSDNLKGRGK